MPENWPIKVLFVLALASTGASSEEAQLVLDQFTPHLAVDAGQIVKGKYSNDLKFQPLNRNTVELAQTATYGEAWEFNVGLEGILWWPFGSGFSEPEKRTMRVEPRLSQAKARLNFASTPDKAYAELGFFPYKYNPDARNLGEYLYRSGTYPGVVKTTDGFHLMDHAMYDAYGAHIHVSLLDGHLKQEVNFFVEPKAIPVGDITPGYELSWSNKVFQVGAGAAYNRFLSFAPSLVAPKNLKNAYIEWDSAGYSVEEPYLATPALIQNRIASGDTSVHYRVLHYWTQRGVKLMGRASVDLGFLLPSDLRGPQDLRIFGEAAVLGLEDQPYYYKSINRRMPVMVGANLPTLKALDLLSLQVEYYEARFDNSYVYDYNSRPVWGTTDFKFATYDPNNFKRDDWKWSLYAEKTVSRLFKIHAQIANDHLRLPDFHYQLSEVDLTQNPKHWYYLVRLEFGG